jgi:hypothetical protein
MAITREFDPNEVKHLNTLICTTNRPVCKHCLEKECDGSCGSDDDDMASAKHKFFTNGAYEHVLANKQDRDIQPDTFVHSPFTKDSYLSTQREVTEEADSSQGQDEQERMCITDFQSFENNPVEGQSPNSEESSVYEDDQSN